MLCFTQVCSSRESLLSMFVDVFPDGFEALGGLHSVSVTQLAHVELGNGFVV